MNCLTRWFQYDDIQAHKSENHKVKKVSCMFLTGCQSVVNFRLQLLVSVLLEGTNQEIVLWCNKRCLKMFLQSLY